MPKNRYDNKLREGNQLIVDLAPSNYVLRIELSLELKKTIKNQKDVKILEIGSGEGDSTKYILENNPSIKIDCLDISKEMIELSKKFLLDYSSRINFIAEDAVDFLNKIDFKYDIIFSVWTIHNFTWKEKINTFKKIYSSLNSGGTFFFMDKVYPDDKKKSIELLDLQLCRYGYLDEELGKEIVDHEKQDMLDDYRMDKTKTLKILKKIGFSEIKIIDRVEREILLVARK